MHRIDSTAATDDNRFTEGDPTIPIAATVVSADWLNAVQEELAAVIEGAGITLNKASSAQLKDALEIMFAEWTPAATATVLGLIKGSASLEIAADGTATVPAATELVAGILKLATSTLALAGVDDTTAMTPTLVKAVVDACRASDADIETGTSITKFPNVAQLIAASEDKANTNFDNVTKPYVTETYKSSDGDSWYRKWSDGFIEQGGVVTALTINTWSQETITFPTPFATIDYDAHITSVGSNAVGGNSPWLQVNSTYPKTTTQFTHGYYNENNNTYGKLTWAARGY